MLVMDSNAICKDEAFVLYENFLLYGTMTSTGGVANEGFPENMRGPQTFDGWEPNITSGNAYMELTQGQVRNYDCFALFGHNLNDVLGPNGLLRFWLRIAGVWTIVSEFRPPDNKDVLAIIPEAPADGMRIQIAMGTGHTSPSRPVISNAFAGKRLIIPNGARSDYQPINLAVDVETRPNLSRGGQFLGTTHNFLGASTSISLARQEREWIEGPAAPFLMHYNRGAPFVWASCPEFMPDDFAYCWRSGDELVPTYGQGAVWGELSMDVSAFLGGARV